LVDLAYNAYHKGVDWVELYEEDAANTHPVAVAGLTLYHMLLNPELPPPPLNSLINIKMK
jgi:hypothetical protein